MLGFDWLMPFLTAEEIQGSNASAGTLHHLMILQFCTCTSATRQPYDHAQMVSVYE